MSLVHCAECGAKISERATACPSCGAPRRVATSETSERVKDWLLALFIVAVVLGSGWIIIEITIGRTEAARMYRDLTNTRSELTAETVTVPTDEFRGVLVAVPYAGTVTLEVTSLGGQPLDVHLIDGTDLLRLAGKKPPLSALKLALHAAFEAKATPTASPSGHLQPGKYVVVLEHPERGAPASEARVVAHVKP